MVRTNCPYATLNVDRTASTAEIKRAYRALALRLHPDKNRASDGASEAFHELNAAYNVLVNEEKRDEYDRGSEDPNSDILEELFRTFTPFGNFSRPSDREAPPVPPETVVEVLLTASDLRTGRKRFVAHVSEMCKNCDASGIAFANARTTRCASCGGKGRSVRVLSPFVSLNSSCEKCRGSGRARPEVTSANACPVCAGRATVEASREIEISLPTGLHDGDIVSVRAHAAGKLTVRIRLDSYCRSLVTDARTGNITIVVDLSLREVLTGFDRRVNVLGEEVRIRSARVSSDPRGCYTDPTRTLLLRGRGLPTTHGWRADCIIRFNVKWPSDDLNDKSASGRVARRLHKFADVTSGILAEDDYTNRSCAVQVGSAGLGADPISLATPCSSQR